MAAVERQVWPLVAEGRVQPVVHTCLPFGQVKEAHELMESSGHIGKILLVPE